MAVQDALKALGDVTAQRIVTQLLHPSSRTTVEDVSAVVHVLVRALGDVKTGSMRRAGEQWLARIFDAFRAAPPARVRGSEAGVAQMLAALLQAHRAGYISMHTATETVTHLTKMLVRILQGPPGPPGGLVKGGVGVEGGGGCRGVKGRGGGQCGVFLPCT